MRICYIGHSFHEKTKSTSFLIDYLRSIGQVDIYGSSPDEISNKDDELLRNISQSSYDLYVFFQTEYIAAKLVNILKGRIVLIPMYDGAHMRPDNFWLQFAMVQIISFSRQLHETFQRLNLNSKYFQYMKRPTLGDFERTERSAFFWHRRPDTKLNINLVMQICLRLGISKIHIHNANDFQVNFQNPRMLSIKYPEIDIEISKWFEDPEDFLQVSSRPTFFFAPRITEGIGMSVLEAFSRGQVVISPNEPTMNEYIRNKVDGILYDIEDISSIMKPSNRDIQLLSSAAIRKSWALYEDWCEDQTRFESVMLGDEKRWVSTSFASHSANTIRRRVAKFIRNDAE